MRIPLVLSLCLLSAAAASAIAAESSAASASGAESYSLMPPRVAQLKAVTVIYRTLHIRSADVEAETAGILELRSVVGAAHLTPIGGPIVIFPQLPTDPSVAIDIDIAIPVADGSKAPEGCEVRLLPAAPAVTAVYQGATSNMGAAISDIFHQMPGMHQLPTGELRSRSLYYEDGNSANNVMLLEIPVVPQ